MIGKAQRNGLKGAAVSFGRVVTEFILRVAVTGDFFISRGQMLISFNDLPSITIYCENGYYKTVKANKRNLIRFLEEFQKEKEGIVYLMILNYKDNESSHLGNKNFLKEQLNKFLTI